MRSIKTTTISILVVGLLVGSVGSAAAQDEEPAAASSSFTGSFTSQLDVVSEPTENVGPDGLMEASGLVLLTSWVASDPRLTGAVTYTGNSLLDTNVEGTSTGCGRCLLAVTYELTNDGGTWLGEATTIRDAELDLADQVIIFEGRDGYEGLTAYAVIDHRPFPARFAGAIFPSAMPTAPEPYQAE